MKQIHCLRVVLASLLLICLLLVMPSYMPPERYNTQICAHWDENGDIHVGTLCSLPDPSGPCTRSTNCRYE